MEGGTSVSRTRQPWAVRLSLAKCQSTLVTLPRGVWRKWSELPPVLISRKRTVHAIGNSSKFFLFLVPTQKVKSLANFSCKNLWIKSKNMSWIVHERRLDFMWSMESPWIWYCWSAASRWCILKIWAFSGKDASSDFSYYPPRLSLESLQTHTSLHLFFFFSSHH